MMSRLPTGAAPRDGWAGDTAKEAWSVTARAPGRLDVMGGIADYSGATVLELPLACEAMVTAQLTEDGLLTVHSEDWHGLAGFGMAEVPVSLLGAGPASDAPERLGAEVRAIGRAWAGYLFGPVAMLRARDLLPPLGGMRLTVRSDIPPGAGVSSSAALEVAALRACTALLGLELDPVTLIRIAQEAEHRVALAPCGIMDQATAHLGRKDHLLVLRCQPAEVLGYLPLPRDVQLYGIDSGVSHRVAGGQYGRVRTAAFMGRAMIAASGDDPPGGYLCNLSPERFEAQYAPLLPESLPGAEFLERFGETGDDATRVEPSEVYRVRDCTAHPIHEAAIVEAFRTALDAYARTGDPGALEAAGEAMERSHRSYGERCGLGTPETDLLVDLVRELGQEAGLFGAKITGGGAGGTVVVLGAGPSARAAVEAVVALYTGRTGRAARLLAGSSDGALAGNTPSGP